MFLQIKRKKHLNPFRDDLADECLVTSYLENGNKEFIALLFERYTHLVYGICLNYFQDTDQCKDAVMEIFESLFQKLTEHKVSNFRNWLYTVTRNHCLMTIRKTGTINRMKDQLKAEGEASLLPEGLAEDEELLFSRTLIQSAVDNLNQEQGTCIRLMYVEDKSYKEISEITGYAMNEVKSHIQNGKRNLKNYLLRQNGTSET